MLAFLVYGIKRIIDIGGKVAIVTATLPPFVTEFLENVYGEFPFVMAEKPFINDTKVRHNVKALDQELDPYEIIRLY